MIGSETFPKATDGGGSHIARGTALLPVSLPATDGGSVCLAALPGRSVVAIYPWTGRPGLPNPPNWDHIVGAHGSTPELEGFRDAASAFGALGVALFGLSRQDTDYQRQLVERLKLPFPILSDAEGAFAGALRLPNFSTGGETYLKRLTLVVRDGSIEKIFYPVTDPAGHAGEVLGSIEGRA